MHLKNIIEKIEVWDDWKNNYKNFVPKFINETINKQNWADWDNEVFYEYFERAGDQCVASLKQGYFSGAEREKIKSNWNNISPLLKKIALSQNVPLFDVYEQLRQEILKYTDTIKDAAIFRMIAGLQPHLLITIVTYKNLNELCGLLKAVCNIKIEDYQYNNWFKDSNRVSDLFKSSLPNLDGYEMVTYPWQTLEYLRNKNINELAMQIENQKIINLLKYKKQIILQGPPGTGKTKLAKEIAQELVGKVPTNNEKVYNIDKAAIEHILKSVDSIKTKSGKELKIVGFKDSTVEVKTDDSQTWSPSYNKIINSYKNKLFDNASRSGGFTPYEDAIAKYLFEIHPTIKRETSSEQVKLIQFHPSYSYEDFVRGIVAESKGDKIEYKNVNRILGQFAKDALDNYELSKKDNSEIQTDKWIEETFADFKNEIEKDVEQKEITLTGNIGIFEVDNDCFRYGKDWGSPSRLNFIDFKNLIKTELQGELKANQNNIPKEISLHAHYRFTYYLALLKIFFAKYQYEETNERPPLRNYVLIIDEINRANLSSVLGELVYALEYRGDKVESMYAIDGKNEMVLPDNLYIIGTMNTADRSVGHIDYAIRRRFAFVDVVPKDLSSEPEINFHKALFDQVADFFNHTTHLSKEFEAKDVQLGHSYFIDKTTEGGSMDIRLEYEIKPILREYVKDGILIGEKIKEIIEDLEA